MQGARIENPVVLQNFVVQGDAVFVAINGVQYIFRFNARGFLLSRVRPNFAQVLCLDPFEVHVLALSFWQEKVLEKLVDVKRVCVLQYLASELDHQSALETLFTRKLLACPLTTRLNTRASEPGTRTTPSSSLGTATNSVSPGDALLGLKVIRCLTLSAFRAFGISFSNDGMSISLTDDILLKRK